VPVPPESTAGARLVRGAVGVGLLQLVGIFLAFASAVVLARALGEDGFGAFSYALTWGLVLLGPATFGLGPILTRETAAGLETGRFGRVRAVRRWAVRVTAIASAVVVGLALVGVLAGRRWLDPVQVDPLLVGVPVAALSAVTLVCRHLLLGLRRVVVAQVAESVVRPAVVLVGVGGAWLAGAPVSAVDALVLYGAATLVGLAWMLWQIRRATPPEVSAAGDDPDPTWLRSAAPLLVTSVARDLNAEAGTLMIGSLLSAGDVGLFRAATRLAALPTYILTAVNLSFQPVAAGLFAKGDLRGIESLGIRASRVALLLALPIVAALLLAGGPMLSLFGPAFPAAAPALAVLALGHLFNVSCGSIGVVLVACRREDDAMRGLLLSCGVTLVANAVLIWAYGLMGAAVATALGLVVWNVALTWYAWRRLGIVPAAFSWRSARSDPPKPGDAS
jgi:O-antigen/teichoic acid export membrane protein